jgi:hypothetical protein
MNIIKGFMLYIELTKNIMILAHIWIENPDMIWIKGCWNNQNNNKCEQQLASQTSAGNCHH